MTDTDKQIIGAIAGALLGALVGAIAGAIGTYKVGESARKKQVQQNEIDYNRKKLLANSGALVEAQNNLHNLLVLCLKNMGHTRDITKGIIDEKIGKAIFTMNLPSPYTIVPNIDEGLLSTELVIQWTALETETVLHNSNINEFNSYYSFLRTSTHSAQISNSRLNMDTLRSDNDTIKKGAQEQLEALEYYRQRCIKVLALIEYHAKQQIVLDYTQITLPGIKQYVKKLIYYKVKDKDLKDKIAELNDQYTEEKAFGVNAIS